MLRVIIFAEKPACLGRNVIKMFTIGWLGVWCRDGSRREWGERLIGGVIGKRRVSDRYITQVRGKIVHSCSQLSRHL